MHTLILSYSESDTDILAFIDRLRSRNKPFKIESHPESNPMDNDNVVWDWKGCENAAYKLSLTSFAEDWDSEADKVWDTL